MKETFGNIWDHINEYDAIVITTNGYVKKNGEAVMGRGIALEAKNRFPGLARWLGQMLSFWGNRVNIFQDPAWSYKGFVITLPVKPEFGPSGAPGWKARANIDLIRNSTKEMTHYLESFKSQINTVLMPRPGCGNGGLKWEDVKPVIEPYLDDRFTVMEKL